MRQRGVANILIIILGFLIILVLIGYFKNQKTPYFNLGNVFNSNINQTQVDENFVVNENGYPYISCGIQINSPFENSKVGNVFEFSGTISGCGWQPQNGFIGVFEMLDAENNPLTDQISVPINPDGNFKINIALKRRPVSNKNIGVIIFKNYNASQIVNFNVYLK